MKKKKENEAGEFARDDHTFRDAWLKNVMKEFKEIKIKETKTSRPDEFEPVLVYRNKKVLQLAHSKVAFFTEYCFEKGKRSILKVKSNEDATQVLGWLKARIVEIDVIEEKSVKAKKVKSNDKKESVADIEERIKKMSPKSMALNLSNPSEEVLSWIQSSPYQLIDGKTLMVRGL